MYVLFVCICMYVLVCICMHIHIVLDLRVEISARRKAHLGLNETDKMHSKLQQKIFHVFGTQTHYFTVVCDHMYH